MLQLIQFLGLALFFENVSTSKTGAVGCVVLRRGSAAAHLLGLQI